MIDASLRLLAWSLLITGAATAQSRPPAVSVVPNAGTGSSRVFVLKASRGSISMLINSTLKTSGACYVIYDPVERKIVLRDDTGEKPAASGEPGKSGVAGNNQCSIDFQRSVSDASSIGLAIAFQPNFAGPKTIWTKTNNGAWQPAGKWTARASINLGAPGFRPIMTAADPPEYLKYDGATKTELDSKANRTTLPFHFLEPASAVNDAAAVSGVCSYADSAPDAPPFWYDFAGNRLAGKFKTTMPSEYFVSSIRPDAGYGLQIRTSFRGALSGAGVMYEAAYFHQQRCDAGGLEFGFYRNVIPAQTVFYISNNSNCGIQPNGYCHVSDSFSSEYMNEDNYPGQALTTNTNGWQIKNLDVNGAPAQSYMLTYSVFILPDRSAANGYRFQVEVFDPATSKHANCDVNDSRGNTLFVNKPCGFPVRPLGWYPVDALYKRVEPAYVTVGIQRQGTPTVETPVDFAVEQVSVPK
jgi:hypothetical protein